VSSDFEDEVRKVNEDWDRAMIGNDADEIGRYMADDWVIVGTDGSVSTKQSFLALVRSRVLSHDVMESHDLRLRVYGDAAVVVARGVSGGRYGHHAFHEVERATSVFVRQEGQWRCVLTHLSRLAPTTGSDDSTGTP
jgi:ketosteroid isomerase-like protein